MRALLLTSMLTAAPAFGGDLVLSVNDPAVEVRLTTASCTDPAVLAMLRKEWRAQFRAARATVSGTDYSGCWIEDDGIAVILFETGEHMKITLAAFRDTGI